MFTYTFELDVPGMNMMTLTEQEENEQAARRAIQKRLDSSYLARDAKLGKLLLTQVEE